jgi:hypothetical protein
MDFLRRSIRNLELYVIEFAQKLEFWIGTAGSVGFELKLELKI